MTQREWPLLADVPAEDVRELLRVARRRTFSRGEVVFHRDDPGDSMHLIRKGRFALRIMTPLGDTVTLAIRGATVNRVLNEEEGRGTVKLRRSKTLVRDVEGLGAPPARANPDST